MRRISLFVLAVLILATAASAQIVLQGTITQDMTLTSNNTYLLRGGVFVGDDVNETILEIEPGTVIYGEAATYGMLVIRRGSKIIADGTANAPIVFTSDQVNPSRSDWGGLILNGRAHLNVPGGEAFGEGSTGLYGGGANPDDSDDSGILRYVRVEYAGREISPDNELNGIAFQGVGNGTTIEYCQVHMNKDDAFEWFGGAANAKYLYATGCADDQFDWTEGWNGKGQFFICQQYSDDADQGIEADNNAENNDATPRAHPTLYNLTLIGAWNQDNGESDVGMLLREGTAGNIYNAIVYNFGEAGLDIDHLATFENAWDSNNNELNGELTVDYSIWYNNFAETTLDSDGGPFNEEDFLHTLNANNIFNDPMLTNPTNPLNPSYAPQAGSPAIGGGMVAPNDGFFSQVDYIGAMAPDENWLFGWTTPGTGGFPPDAVTQTTSLVGNRFELVSLYVSPLDLAATSIFDIDGLQIVLADDGGIFWPAFNINTIGDVNPTEGYKVFVDDDIDWENTGALLGEDATYDLVAGPWNFVGFPFAGPVDLETALADILSHVVAVQDDDGNLYWPGVGIYDLTTLQPGAGYQIIVDQNVSFNFNDGVQ